MAVEPLPIPDEEIAKQAAEMMAISGLAEILTLDQQKVFLNYLTNELARTAAVANASLYEAFRASITREISSEAYQRALVTAADAARREASTTVAGLMESSLKAVGQTIGDGLKAGLHPDAIARQLDMIIGLDSGRARRLINWEKFYQAEVNAGRMTEQEMFDNLSAMYDTLLRERKESIATTEARIVTSESRDLEARARGAQYKAWATSRMANVCDICMGNQAQGPIGINESFGDGSATSPAHPDCHCHIVYGTSDEQRDRMAEHSERRDQQTQAAKANAEADKAAKKSKVPPAPKPAKKEEAA